jgi:nitroreductase
VNKNLEFIYKRHSIRRFKDEDVPTEDIKKIIEAATYAPSGRNLQNWHFVVVKNKEKLNEIEKRIRDKAKSLGDDSSLSYTTFFKDAPATIFVYAGPYPMSGIEMLEQGNASKQEIEDYKKHSPGIQNIGSVMQTLLLAAANLGYGGCWMTGPMFAKKEIEEYIGLNKEGYELVCITPLGVPEESELTSPARKPVEEVLTIIE